MSGQEALACAGRSVWGEHGFHRREFHKHSVERDVKSFIGWEKLNEIIEVSKAVGPDPLLNGGFTAARALLSFFLFFADTS